jgi:hypothetical protein
MVAKRSIEPHGREVKDGSRNLHKSTTVLPIRERRDMRSTFCTRCTKYGYCARDCGQCPHLQAGGNCEAWETLLSEFEKIPLVENRKE